MFQVVLKWCLKWEMWEWERVNIDIDMWLYNSTRTCSLYICTRENSSSNCSYLVLWTLLSLFKSVMIKVLPELLALCCVKSTLPFGGVSFTMPLYWQAYSNGLVVRTPLFLFFIFWFVFVFVFVFIAVVVAAVVAVYVVESKSE